MAHEPRRKSKIFNVAHKNLGEKLGKKEFEQLGSAIHGLEDAERHKGAIYSSGKGNEHSLMGDMFGNPVSTKEITSTVALLYGMLQGDFGQVGEGKYLYIPGMSIEQLSEVMRSALNNGYNASYDGNSKKLTLSRQ